jgi:hypothetical protein
MPAMKILTPPVANNLETPERRAAARDAEARRESGYMSHS